MLKKYLLFLIIITIAAIMATNTMAVELTYYVTLTIKTFTTAVEVRAGEEGVIESIKFEQNSASAIVIAIDDSNPTEIFTQTRTASRSYGAGDTMTVGPITMTQGESHSFKITFDEIQVGASKYYGSCTTNSNLAYCAWCNGFESTASCPTRGTQPLGSNGFAPYVGSAGVTSQCTGTAQSADCSRDFVPALDEGLTKQFSLSFTP